MNESPLVAADPRELVREERAGGRLHVDRGLPFLCLFRDDGSSRARATAEIASAMPAYAVLADADQERQLERHVHAACDKLGGFFLVELLEGDAQGELGVWLGDVRPGTALVERLVEELATLAALDPAPAVVLRDAAPRGLRPVPGLVQIGLELPPAYVHPESQAPYVLLLQALRKELSAALRTLLARFLELRLERPWPGGALPGRRHVLATEWAVDRELTEISRSYDFLLSVTPINGEPAWEAFRAAGFERAPTLRYRPLTLDPDRMRRRLFEVALEHVEEPVLAALFRAERDSIDQRLRMLAQRDTPAFFHDSLQLYGTVEKHLERLARAVISSVAPPADEAAPQVDAEALRQAAERELDHYRQQVPELDAEVLLRDDIASVMVVKGNLLIPRTNRVPAARVHALLQHEIGTHIVTYVNGGRQPLQLLAAGLSGYDELQEGLAVLAEYLVGGLSPGRLRLLAGRVLAIHFLIDGASFVEVFRRLVQDFGFAKKTAFFVTLRVFRSGGLTKDAVYLRGILHLLQALSRGARFETLLLGKLGFDHVGMVDDLSGRGILRPPVLRPRYLSLPDAQRRLERVRRGVSVLELFQSDAS